MFSHYCLVEVPRVKAYMKYSIRFMEVAMVSMLLVRITSILSWEYWKGVCW